MSTKNKFEWKTAGIVVLILAGIFMAATAYIKSKIILKLFLLVK